MQAKHIKGTISLCAALLAGVALFAASGAGAAKPRAVAKIDVSTKAAVDHYLRSIHVNPKGVVIQRGARNYAGPNCPGKRWTCASTKHTVVQIAKRGGQNRFVCRSSKCVVVQISGASHGVYAAGRTASAVGSNKGGNSGYCVKTGSGTLSGGGQTCSIMQTATGSGANTAGIYEVTSKVSGLVQTVQFAATIQQKSGSGDNTACVTQAISQTASTTNTNGKPTNVSLEATQTIVIQQDSATGNNSAVNGANPTTGTCGSQTLSQSQNQTSIVTATGDITQNMNPTPNGTTNGNASLDIEQNQAPRGIGTGTNSAVFSQKTNQQAVANTKNLKTVTQLQNSTQGDGLATPFSGIVGTINQDSKGQSTATVTQDEIQCEDAANTSNSAALTGCSTTSDAVPGITLSQTQNGPVGLFTPPAKSAARVPYFHKGNGKSELTGAVAPNVDTFHLTQTSSQYADTSGPNTTVNQSNIMQGDCASSGNGSATGGTCEASQLATLNGGTTAGNTQDGYTAGSIDKLLIKCVDGHGSCTATPPPKPVITTKPTATSEDTSPTFAWTEGGTGATVGISFDCSIDSGDPVSCDSGDTFPVGLGPHTFEVTASDNFGHTSAAASWAWTVVPYLTFEQFGTGSSAGWSDTPGSPIKLIVGTDPESYGQFTLHNFEGIKISDLPEPMFHTDFYFGAPRYEIDLDNGDYLFGYPPEAGLSGSWDINCDHAGCAPFVSWADVLSVEGSATVTDVLIEADSNPGDTYHISSFSFDGYVLDDFTNHFH
jgi:hypothetical protein